MGLSVCDGSWWSFKKLEILVWNRSWARQTLSQNSEFEMQNGSVLN